MKKMNSRSALKQLSFMAVPLKKTLLIMLIAGISFCYIACGAGAPKDAAPMSEEAYENQTVAEDSYEEKSSEEAGKADASAPASNPEIKKQKLIKTGSIHLEVNAIDKAYKEIDMLTQKYNGYIFEMDKGGNEYQKYMHLTTKIDSKHFDVFMQSFADIGQVKDSSISTQDVTREYIDTEARINTLTVQENTLRELMSKATKIEDLLRIESELQRVRQEIESTQGQLNYLKDAVSYSTIYINLNEKTAPTANKKNIWDQLSFHFQDGFGYWGSVFVDFISFIIWMMPVWITLFILYKLLKKPLKKLKEKMANRKNNKL